MPVVVLNLRLTHYRYSWTEIRLDVFSLFNELVYVKSKAGCSTCMQGAGKIACLDPFADSSWRRCMKRYLWWCILRMLICGVLPDQPKQRRGFNKSKESKMEILVFLLLFKYLPTQHHGILRNKTPLLPAQDWSGLDRALYKWRIH